MSWVNQPLDEIVNDGTKPSELVTQQLLYEILVQLREMNLYLKVISDEDLTDDASDDTSLDHRL